MPEASRTTEILLTPPAHLVTPIVASRTFSPALCTTCRILDLLSEQDSPPARALSAGISTSCVLHAAESLLRCFRAAIGSHRDICNTNKPALITTHASTTGRSVYYYYYTPSFRGPRSLLHDAHIISARAMLDVRPSAGRQGQSPLQPAAALRFRHHAFPAGATGNTLIISHYVQRTWPPPTRPPSREARSPRVPRARVHMAPRPRRHLLRCPKEPPKLLLMVSASALSPLSQPPTDAATNASLNCSIPRCRTQVIVWNPGQGFKRYSPTRVLVHLVQLPCQSFSL